jgi:uncharacterized membrane protein
LSLTSAIAWIAWTFVIRGIYVPLRPDVAVASEQIRFILSHPVKFAFILFNDFNVNIQAYIAQFIGVLGWLDTPLPSILYISYSFLLVFIALVDSRPNIIITLRDKLKIVAIVLSSILLIYLLTYLSWTPVGQELVEGIQGRYFIPVAPLLFLVLYNRRILLNIRNSTLGLIIVLYSLFALIISLSVIINRYYAL